MTIPNQPDRSKQIIFAILAIVGIALAVVGWYQLGDAVGSLFWIG